MSKFLKNQKNLFNILVPTLNTKQKKTLLLTRINFYILWVQVVRLTKNLALNQLFMLPVFLTGHWLSQFSLIHIYGLVINELTQEFLRMSESILKLIRTGMKDSRVYTAVHTVQYAVTVQGFFENWNTVFFTGLGFYRVFGVQICKITVFLQWPINFVRIKTGFNSVFYWDRIKSLGFTGFFCEFCKHCDTAVFILSLYSVLGQYSISDAKKPKFHPCLQCNHDIRHVK